jgi:hypothetical protein
MVPPRLVIARLEPGTADQFNPSGEVYAVKVVPASETSTYAGAAPTAI